MRVVRVLLRRRELAVPAVLVAGVVAGSGMGWDGYLPALTAGVLAVLVAFGVVLVFRADGFVSFAAPALASTAATATAVALRYGTALVALAVVSLPPAAAGVGLLGHRAVFHPLRDRLPVVRTLGGLLLAQGLLAVAAVLAPHAAAAHAGSAGLKVFVLGFAAAVALATLLSRVRSGAVLSSCAGLLAGVAGVLAGLCFPLAGGPFTAAIVGAPPMVPMAVVLIGAVVGDFGELITVAVTVLALSLAQEALSRRLGDTDPFQLLLLPVVFAGLMLRARRPDPAPPDPVPQPLKPGPVAEPPQAGCHIGGVLFALALLPIVEELLRPTAALGGYLLVALSLLILMGWVGQVTLGQLGFATLGAWIVATGVLPRPLGLLLAGSAAAVLSVLIGLPAVRHAGVPAPVTSLAFGIFAQVLFESPRLLGHSGPVPRRPSPHASDMAMAVLVAATVVGCLVLVAALTRTRFVRVLADSRGDARVAAAAGLRLPRARLQAMVLTGFLAGIAGALIAIDQKGLLPMAYSGDTGMRLVATTGVSGMADVAAPVLGGGVLFPASAVDASAAVRYALTGLIGLVLLRLEPDGAVTLLQRAAALVFGERGRLVLKGSAVAFPASVTREATFSIPSTTDTRRRGRAGRPWRARRGCLRRLWRWRERRSRRSRQGRPPRSRGAA